MIHGVEFFSRYVVGVLLLFGSIFKWANFPRFVRSLENYELMPPQMAGLAAFFVASLELFIGVALLLAWWLPWSAYGALTLFFVFTFAISVNLAKGKFEMDCGCGFWGKSKIGWHLVVRNLGLAGLAIVSGALWSITHLYVWIFFLSIALVLVPVFPKLTFHHS